MPFVEPHVHDRVESQGPETELLVETLGSDVPRLGCDSRTGALRVCQRSSHEPRCDTLAPRARVDVYEIHRERLRGGGTHTDESRHPAIRDDDASLVHAAPDPHLVHRRNGIVGETRITSEPTRPGEASREGNQRGEVVGLGKANAGGRGGPCLEFERDSEINETAAATQCVCERRRMRARDDEVDATETASLCVVQGPCDGLVIDLRAGDRDAEELGVPRQRSYPAWHVACGTTGVRAS